MTEHNFSTADVLDIGDGFVYPRSAGLKGAVHLFKAMRALHEYVDPDRFVSCLAELLGGPHWLGIANELADELEANPGLFGREGRTDG